MKIIKLILPFLFAVLLMFSGVSHLFNPEVFAAMIPDFVPQLFANIASAIVEVTIALLLIIPKYRKTGGLLFAFLMVAFLPIHIWDIFRENPAIGEAPAPLIRLVFQFALIFGGWWIYKKHEDK